MAKAPNPPPRIDIDIDHGMEQMTDIDLDRPIGIISALPEEEEAFGPYFDEIESADRLGFPVRHGTMDGKPVVLMRSGIGKVNAAIATMVLLNEFYCGAIIMAGVAGALDRNVQIGDVIVGNRIVQHDYGALIDERIKAYQPGDMPLPGHEGPIGYAPSPEMQEKIKRATRGLDLPPLSRSLTNGELRMPKIHVGTILTGDTFINCPRTRDRLAYEFGASAVEMEGGAIAQVAHRMERDCVIVRGISDLVGSNSHIDFPAFAHDVSVAVTSVVRRLVGVI